MIEFQKEYLEIINQQKQKALIMQSVFGDYLQPFNDIASFVDGDFVGDTPDATASNMDNAINNVTSKLSYMKPMTDYVKEKGKALTKAFVSPIQMCKTGGNVSQKAQQNGQNAGKFAQRQSYKAVEEECKRKNIRIKGITTESIIAESAPYIKKCAKEHSREVSEFLRHCILEDAKQGITPNMWFDSHANPADQRDIIFENTTISFKTNNGVLICEEIQNKSKKRHLISEAVVKQATRMPNAFNINTWLSNVNENHGSELCRVQKYFQDNPDKAEIFDNFVMGKTDDYSPKQAAEVFNDINQLGIDPNDLALKGKKGLDASQEGIFRAGNFDKASTRIATVPQADRKNIVYNTDDIKNLNNNITKVSSTLAATSKKSDTSGTQQDFPEGSTLRRTKNREYELVDKDGNRIKKIPAKQLTDAQKEAAKQATKQAQHVQIKPADTQQVVNTTGVKNGLPSGQASKVPFANKGKFDDQDTIWKKIKWILKSIYQLIYRVVGFICQLILGLILTLLCLIKPFKLWLLKTYHKYPFDAAKAILNNNPVGRGVIHTFSIGSIVLAVYGIGAAIAGMFSDDQKKELEQAKIDPNDLDLQLISDFGV